MRGTLIALFIFTLFCFASVATAGCENGVCTPQVRHSILRVDVSAEVAPLARVSVAVGRSANVAVNVAAGPVRVVAKLGNAVRERERHPVAKVVSFIRIRR